MLRLVLKQTLAHRARLLLTFVAITLGVAFVVGTLVLTDTSRRVFDDQFRDASSDVDVVVRDAVAFDAAMGVEVERDPLEPDLARRVSVVSGVARAIPVAKGTGLLIAHGRAIVPSGPSLLTSWSGVDGFTLRSGSAPDGPGQVVLDAATAQAHGIAIGDTVRVQADHQADLRVVGLAGFGKGDGLPDTTVVLVDLATAQRLLDLGDHVSQISVVAAAGTAAPTLADRLRDALGADLDVTTSQDTASASADAAQAQLGYIAAALLALAGAALVIGAFLIANTFSVLVTQRTRELAVMRAAGATGRQVLISILGEAAVLGVAGSAAGIGTGMVAARGLRALLAAAGATVPDGPAVLSTRTVVAAVSIGVMVTVLAALGAARRAARVSPVVAMREGATDGAHRSRIRPLLGTLVATPGLVVLGIGAARQSLTVAGVGAAAVVAALVVLAPVVAPAAANLIGRAFGGRGVPGRLARESTRRAPRRTGATVMALGLSLALVVFVAVMGASVRTALRSDYREAITADLVVESARGEMLGGLEPTVYDRIRDLDEVGAVSRLRYGHWKDAGGTRALTAVDPATLGEVTAIEMAAGRLTDLARGGVAISRQQAVARGLGVGDEIAMTFARTGTVRVPVVGLIDDTDVKALSTDYVISLASYRDWFAERVDASLLVRAADGVGGAEARDAVAAAVRDLPTVEVRDQAAAAQARTATLDGILTLITAVLLLTVLIAMLGITNTLALSIVERTRELGLLRAVGMTRRQLRAMIRAEALLIAITGLVLGTAVGLGVGAVFVHAMARGGSLGLRVPPTGLGLVAVTALAVGVIAGIAPARRAARLEVLAAIHER
jgi:putative ABC transport system permease protein